MQRKEQKKVFQALKKAFVLELALAAFNLNLVTILECNASRQATGRVLLQYSKDSLLYAVAYFLVKNTLVEVNYTIYNKKLLAVIKCLEAQQTDLKQVKSFTVITDYKNLEYFYTTRLLTERHIQQLSLLSQFNLTFTYCSRNVNRQANALSRKEEDVLAGTKDKQLET